MRKQCLRILIALIGVAGLGMAARGQAIDQIVLNVRYEFVVAGKTSVAGGIRFHIYGCSTRAVSNSGTTGVHTTAGLAGDYRTGSAKRIVIDCARGSRSDPKHAARVDYALDASAKGAAHDVGSG